MWAINIQNINSWWNGEWLGVPGGGSSPPGYYCQCNDTIDVLDENGLTICSLRCTVTPNADPTKTENNITFDGSQVLSPVSGVLDDSAGGPPYDWGYGCGVDLGSFNLSISGGLSSAGPGVGCAITSLTTPSIAGACSAAPINPNADIMHSVPARFPLPGFPTPILPLDNSAGNSPRAILLLPVGSRSSIISLGNSPCGLGGSANR